MTRAPSLSARMKALAEAAEIAEERALRSREAETDYEKCRTDRNARLLMHIERSAALEAELIARLIRERMQDRRTRNERMA